MNALIRSAAWRARNLLRSWSVEVARFSEQNADWQLRQAIRRHGIRQTLDVGANRGQFAEYLRLQGFKGLIRSFEPVPFLFDELQRKAARSRDHLAYNLALSDSSGEQQIFIGENDQTSSLRRVDTVDSFKKYLNVQSVALTRVERLDNFCAQEGIQPSDVFLKLDVQGNEMAALNGAGRLLEEFPIILLEVPIVRMYEGEVLIGDFLEFLDGKGFNLIGIKGGYFHPEERKLMQIDLLVENARCASRA